ncbi:fibronectin type III domain-containing protein [Desulfonema limicola]|uniref:Fibronectin type III domain-containing protein n=1 Tax=Desulfonema limicola TaxID=45656 RepID=A0A975BCE9_9BACT|nr:hypothetical protein [Desulfonema limicola]QTA83104.1 fibronectin type III domain-containing protein [Desulfonema limicola]
MFIKKHLPMGIILGFITVFAVVFSTVQAYGINQEISIVPDMSAPSGSVYVNVQYNCTDNSVTGLGIRVHFNSARLTYNGYDSFLSSGSLSDPQVQNDTENHDADISTDKFILLGYQDMNGNWPGQSLPAILARLKFTASGTGGSELRVSRVTNAAGFGFTGSGIWLNLPSVTTSPAGSITQTGAGSGGNVVSAGGAPVVSRGVCWSTSQNPTISNSKTSNGSGIGSFSSTISGLLPNTTYYVRAYATSSLGTGYGSQVSFTTTQAASIPTVTTSTPGSITQTGANSGGNVTSDGGASVTSRGVCWSTSQNPTTAGSKTSNGSGTGIFSSAITGLSPGTSYYVRAYAVNSKGTGYGNQVSFTTSSSYFISGYARSSANGYGISGVTMSFGSLGSVITDNSGYYTKTVNPGWTGAITPSISGYTFNPGSRSYTSVSSSLFNQDFSGTPATLSISGYVRNSSGAGVSGVSISLSNSGGTAVTDTSGYYTKSVSYGWSGTVTPQKSGYTFTPADKSFSNVTANQSNQDFAANLTDFSLQDIILVLKILTGTTADDLYLKADADKNGKVEISDAIYIMQKIAD